MVMEGLGRSKGYELLKAYDKLIDLGLLCWQYHFEFLNLGYAAYVTFLDFCQKTFPDIPLQRVTQMVSGIDVIMYRPDEELKKLARVAIDLGVADLVNSGKKIAGVVADLEQSSNGKEWLGAFEKARYPWFWTSTGTGWYHHDKSWNDDLDIPLASICIYIDKLQSGATIERPMNEVIKERDRITAEYRSLLQNEEEIGGFDQLLGTARTVFPYVENHLFYVEHWFHSVFWNKMREVAAILKGYKFIDDIEDVWYLKRAEIKDALWDVVTAWATGREAARTQGMAPLRSPGARASSRSSPSGLRRPRWEPRRKSSKSPLPWSFGASPTSPSRPGADVDAAGDPDSITELKGFAGSPGAVEGKARVCRTVAEIGELKEGEILVAPTTSPSWAPAFQKIQACVTDVGGVMCHAAIVCREYGMPAVVGTGHATSIIKTGMDIKVDGATGKVTLVR